MTGRSCAYWEAEIWERHGKYGDRYACVVTEKSQARHFLLEDATGTIPVLFGGASWTLESSNQYTENPPDAAHEFLARHGKKWNPNDFKLMERRLEDGGELYVLGTLCEARDAARGRLNSYRSSFASLMAGLFAPGSRASWLGRRAGYAGAQTARYSPVSSSSINIAPITSGRLLGGSLRSRIQLHSKSRHSRGRSR